MNKIKCFETQIGASNLCYLIYLNNLIRSRAVINRFYPATLATYSELPSTISTMQPSLLIRNSVAKNLLMEREHLEEWKLCVDNFSKGLFSREFIHFIPTKKTLQEILDSKFYIMFITLMINTDTKK